MELRPRLTLLAAGTVALAILLAAVVCYLAMRGELYAQVDRNLTREGSFMARAERILSDRRELDEIPRAPKRLGRPVGTAQLFGPDGEILRPANPVLPITELDRQVLAGRRGTTLTDREVDGTHLRVLTTRLSKTRAVQLAQSLENVDSTLARLRLVLLAALLLGTLFAIAVSRLFSRTVIEPVTHLTEAAERIAATDDLRLRVGEHGDDEVGRLAKRFNEMLDRLRASRGALASSVDAQRQLIADASHELRTPITSLRTNLEVLLEGRLEPADRHRLLVDVRAQAEELSSLINDVIELARGDQPPGELEEVALDAVVREAVERARRHAPGVSFTLATEPTTVLGLPDRLGRAVTNLLDNAAKYGGARVEVSVADGRVAVSDDGAGIVPEEAAHIFDRFHRGASSQGRPGSGLGLAIVRQVAEAHGGSVTVEGSAGGGACFRLSLPAADGHPAAGLGVQVAGPPTTG